MSHVIRRLQAWVPATRRLATLDRHRPPSCYSLPLRASSTAAVVKIAERSDDDFTPSKPHSNPAHKTVSDILKAELGDSQVRNLRRELRWLQDPAKLAENVRGRLQRKDFSKALNLLRLSSPYMTCIVGWNAVVDYLVEIGEFNNAFKVFNEMKKRAQPPDAITITLLLRGLARKPVAKQQVDLATRIYKSLTSQNSKIKPNIVHTNALLQVYCNARDMTKVWETVSELPEEGDGSMNHVSFSALLHGFREQLMALAMVEETPEIESQAQQYMTDHNQLWSLALQKWEKGRLRMDSQLVGCHLQMLLLSPDRESSEAVLRCIETTTGISMREGPTSSPEHSTSAVTAEKAHRGKLVDPDNLILSAAITARTRLLDDKVEGLRDARSYWKVITGQHNVLPDNDNYKTYLRHAIKTFDSTLAAEAIEQLQQDLRSDDSRTESLRATPSMFLLALTACAADAADASHIRAGARSRRPMIPGTGDVQAKVKKLKQDATDLVALDNANRIFSALEETLKDTPLIYTARGLRKYLSCALSSHSLPGINDAIRRLEPSVRTIVFEAAGSIPATGRRATGPEAARFRTAVADADALVWLYATTIDLLVSKEGVEMLRGQHHGSRDVAALEQLFRFAQNRRRVMDAKAGARGDAADGPKEEVARRQPSVPFGKRSIYDGVFQRMVKQGATSLGDDGRELFRFLKFWETKKGSSSLKAPSTL